MKRLIAALIALAALCSSLADARNLNASLKVERSGQTARYELKLDEPRTDQFLLWVWRADESGRRAQGKNRYSLPLEPTAPGVYRFEIPAQDSYWRYYGRIGVGQAGYVSSGELPMPSGTEPMLIGWSLWNSFEDTVPDYVQPVGYAVYFLIAAFALGGTAFVLMQLARRNTARPA